METELITGNTYPVKDAIKALGGRWNADAKGWNVPLEKADEARKLVAGAVSTPRDLKAKYRPTHCKVCGARAGQGADRYGRYGLKIYGSGECRDCYEERKMGY